MHACGFPHFVQRQVNLAPDLMFLVLSDFGFAKRSGHQFAPGGMGSRA